MGSARPRAAFVGRLEALDVLRQAFARTLAGQAGAVFVSGEAGIGKSRLVAEFVSGIDDGWILTGGCLELGEEAPSFAPFTAALRALVREVGVARVAELLPGEISIKELARLLPVFGDPPSEVDWSRGHLFETVLALLERLAEVRPVVLVIEDLHWADRSSRELLTFLVHNQRDARVLLIVTHRDLPHGHPLWTTLADTARADGVARLDLPRFTRNEVASQAAGILGRPATPAVVDEVFARSGGNPLFGEILLAEPGVLDDTASGQWRDLLVASVERLPGETQRMLRVAAVGGNEVSHGLLAVVSGGDGTLVDDALRPAVHERVLVPTDAGYEFRHVLIRDAIYRELVLPGERVRLHRRYAEAIDARHDVVSPDHVASESAHHWYAAGDVSQAFSASWRAAEQARVMLAPAERLTMLDRVLRLWERVPDPAGLVGVRRYDVLRDALEAADDSGELDRGLALADHAVGEADEELEPLHAAWMHYWRARIHSRLGMTDTQADVSAAIRLVRVGPDIADRARLLGKLAHRLCLEGASELARELAERARSLAVQTADRYAEAQAITTQASLWADQSELAKAYRAYARARLIAEDIGAPRLAIHVDIHESHVLEGVGEHTRAARTARGGLVRAREAGMSRTVGTVLAENLAESLISLGEWDEALEILGRAISIVPSPLNLPNLYCLRGRVLLARGDLDAAADDLEAVFSLLRGRNDLAMYRFAQASFAAEVLLGRGRPDEVVAVLEQTLDVFDPVRDPRYAWPLIVVGARAAEGLRARARLFGDAGGQARAATMASRLAEYVGILPCRTPVEQAHRASYAVLTAATPSAGRAAGQAAVEAWQRTGQQWPLAQALLSAAGKELAAGDRGSATPLLRRCLQLAEQLGATPLVDQAHILVEQARITLADDKPARPAVVRTDPFGLTPREADVLRLVATGLTNRQIADQLFISDKTVSVHVSHILGKLGVANRGEAAAVTYRLGLFHDDKATKA